MNSPHSGPLENRFGHGVEGLLLVAFIGVIAAIALPVYDKYGGMVVAIVAILVLGAIFFLLETPGYFVVEYIFRPVLLSVRSLTPQQEISLEEYANKWRGIINSTEPAGRAKAKEAVRLVYKAAGLEPPEHYIWLDSPLQGTVCVSMIDFTNSGFGSIVNWDVFLEVKSTLEDKVTFRVKDSVMALVKEKLEINDPVNFLTVNSLNELIDVVESNGYFEDEDNTQKERANDKGWVNTMNDLMERLEKEHGIVVDKQKALAHPIPKWTEYSRLEKPNNEANSIGLYQFFANEFSFEYLKRLEPVIELTKQCGWWWPYQNAIILTERPKYIKLDGASEELAIEYRDGWKVYAVDVGY